MDVEVIYLIANVLFTVGGWQLGKRIWASKGADPGRRGQSAEDLMRHPLSPLSRGADFNDMFCNDLDEDTASWLLSNLREDPVRPFTDPVSIATLPAGIPSTYILLEKDLALLPEYQLEQAHNAGVDEVVKFDAGHSAFASKPAELAQRLREGEPSVFTRIENDRVLFDVRTIEEDQLQAVAAAVGKVQS